MTADADGPASSIDGIGRPRIARRCSSNSLGNCEISVTMPVSCGRGRELGKDRLVAAHEELDSENAVAAERLDHLARLVPRRVQRLARDRRRLPAFAIVAGFLAVADRRAEDDAVAGRDGQQRDLAVEGDKFLDDDPRPVAAHVGDRMVPRLAELLGVLAMDWPLPELDMTGLTTHGRPTSSAAAIASSRLSAKR